MSESLRERVARELSERFPDLWTLDAADAAIALVVGECARVAVRCGDNTPRGCQRAFDPVRFRAGENPNINMCNGRFDIQAAILALNGKKP